MSTPENGSDDSGRYPPGWVPDGKSAQSRRSWDSGRIWRVGLAALAVVVAVVVAIVLTSSDGESESPAAPPPPSGAPTPPSEPSVVAGPAASAGDVGPVAIITSDVTCQSWRAVQSTMTEAQSAGWEQRDSTLPAEVWTPEQRSEYERVGEAMRTTADDAVGLAAMTPHRAMRELYEAYTAYGRAYANALAAYQPAHDIYARANIAAFQSISEICAAADSGAAIARGAAVPPAAPPTAPAPVDNPADPPPFIPEAGPTCARWVPAEAALVAEADPWLWIDGSVPFEQWTPEQRAIQDQIAARFAESADTLEADGRGSGNAAFEDFATLAAQYFRAFTAAVPNYAAADRDLGVVGLRLDTLVSAACQAAAVQ